MRIKLILFFLMACCAQIMAQSAYEIAGNGQGKNGAYYVKVTTVVKNVKTAKDELRRDAVHGVLFKGIMNNTDGGANLKPLVNDPNIEKTKAEFFNAFWNEKAYEKYVSMTEASFTSTKVKKGYEVSALMLVDKERLLKYLEESGIVDGFSNMW